MRALTNFSNFGKDDPHPPFSVSEGSFSAQGLPEQESS